jgi:chloramphenicol 3-O-phosphotransferase
MTDMLKSLIGKTVDEDVAQKDLEKLAKTAGYTRCQLREPGNFYDMQFDTTRLQVHVDAAKKITDLREG